MNKQRIAFDFIFIVALLVIWLPHGWQDRMRAAYECLRGNSVMYGVNFTFKNDQKTGYVTAIIKWRDELHDETGTIAVSYSYTCWGKEEIVFSTDPNSFKEHGCGEAEIKDNELIPVHKQKEQ